MTKNLADELQRTARQALSGLHPAPQGEEAGGLPFRKLLAATFRARYLVFGTTLFGILVGSFLAITSANSYVSTGKFLFTASGAEKTTVDSQRSTDTSQETIGTAASYILSTDELLKRVVDRLTPARILAPYKPGNPGDSAFKGFFFMVQRDWNATDEAERTPEEALKRLRRTISIERPKYTEVLVATCSANDPKLAQEILAVYLVEAPKFHIEQYEEKRAYEQAERTADEAVLATDAARRALREFLEQKANVQNFSEEMKRLLANETEASTRVTKKTDDLAIAQSMVELLTKQLEGPDAIKRSIPIMKKVDKTSETLTRLQQSLAAKVDARVELIAKGVPSSDARVIELDRAIKEYGEAMSRVLEEAKIAPLEEVVIDNPLHVAKTAERSKTQSEVDRLKAELNQAVEIQRTNAAQLKRLLELEPQFAKLNNTVMSAEDNMKVTGITWQAAQQKELLGQGHFSSLRVFEQASLPLEKEGPNRGKLLLGGMLVGLFLGLGVVILRALPDTIVRTRDDLEHIDGISVIGVMPRLDARNIKRHSHLRGQGW